MTLQEVDALGIAGGFELVVGVRGAILRDVEGKVAGPRGHELEHLREAGRIDLPAHSRLLVESRLELRESLGAHELAGVIVHARVAVD